MHKIFIRFYTIADYEDEELWLRKQHQNGWKLVRLTPPCFYVFESCRPEDVVYRLDYKNSGKDPVYTQLAEDFGWEYIDKCFGWLYFRKAADTALAEGEDELFSDNASRVEMVSRIVRTRLIPLAIIFLCCVMPNFFKYMNGSYSAWDSFFAGFFSVMFVIYIYLIVHCGLKLKAIRNKYEL